MKIRLSRTVLILGLVSFFNDLSSEMIYPLLPLFLTGAMGAGAAALGVIEGVAESTASILKLLSGIAADRMGRRKPLVIGGYGLSGFVRPLIGLAGTWPVVLFLRFADRVGKGLRTSPRDALIADSTPVNQRGRAYGFHRAMDHGGAVCGPLAAAGLLAISGVGLREVFLLAAVPGVAVMLLIIFGVREPAQAQELPQGPELFSGVWNNLGKNFKILILATVVFTLGNSADAFILLLLSNSGVPAAWVAVLWSAHHVVKMAATYFGGRFSDVVGRKKMIVSGWIIYGIVYVLFALVDDRSILIGVFLCYGIYFGFTEPSEKAWVADLAPESMRGAAFGWYHMASGIAALPASLIFGVLWQTAGAGFAFATGAALALAASIILAFVKDAPAYLAKEN